MNDPKPSGIVLVCPETFSLLRYISKNVLHIPERRIQVELYRSADEVANRVSYNDVKEIIRALQAEGKTILMTSHNYEDIETLCNEVYVLEEGTLGTLPADEMKRRFRG